MPEGKVKKENSADLNVSAVIQFSTDCDYCSFD